MKIYIHLILIVSITFLIQSLNYRKNEYQNARILQQQPINQQLYQNVIKDVQQIQNHTNYETAPQSQSKCPCLNHGKCYIVQNNTTQIKKQQNIFCKCPQGYLGRLCEQKAMQLPVNTDIYQLIRKNKYKYFYYQPQVQNTYSFQFHICFSQTDQQSMNSNQTYQQQIQKSITFFFTLQNIDGSIELNETQNQPQTIVLQLDQCKHIYADYTTFSLTQTKQIQKLILAVKLGYQLYHNITVHIQSDSPDKKKNHPKYQLDSKSMNSSKLKYHTDSPNANKKYTKQYLQRQLNPNTTRLVYIDFNISPFTVEQVFQNLMYSLATIASFIIVAFLLFILRTKILGLALVDSFNSGHGLENDIKHFQKYMPPQSFRQQNSSNMDINIHDQDQQQCVICLKVFLDGQQVRRTPCDHVFHKQCIDSWCLQNLTCPVCRKSLTQKNLKQLDQPSLLQIRTNSDSND